MAIRAVIVALSAAVVMTAAASAADPVPGAAPLDPTVEVARVGTASVSRSTFDHWLRIAYRRNALKGSPRCPLPAAGGDADTQLRSTVVAFLLASERSEAEAARRSIHATRTEVHRSVLRAAHRAFPRPGTFARFLRGACETSADVEFRQRITILQRRVLADVRASGVSLEEFSADYTRRWHEQTLCAPGFITSECSNTT